MSGYPPSADSQARRRAAITLGIVALVAIAIVLLMIVFVHTPNHNQADVPPPVETSTSTKPTAHRTSAPVRSSTHPHPTSSPAKTSSSPPTTCPTTAACVLPGDPGQVVAAISAYRAAHNLPAVTGSATAALGQCALQSGNVPPCTGGYFWEPVSGPSGADVVSKIAAQRTGEPWLLDPTFTTVAVGWSATAPGSYQCAVMEVSR